MVDFFNLSNKLFHFDVAKLSNVLKPSCSVFRYITGAHACHKGMHGVVETNKSDIVCFNLRFESSFKHFNCFPIEQNSAVGH